MGNNQVKYIVISSTEEKSLSGSGEPLSAEAGDQDSVEGDAILKNSEEVLWFYYTQRNIIAILNS